MKKVITLFLLLACYFVAIAQQVNNPVYFGKFIKVKDSIQAPIYRQGPDTLITFREARLISGSGTGKENTLPTPASNGLFLTSTTSNVRSWAALPAAPIPSQLKNYNPNQDTVIRFPNLASGKFGIWQSSNNGNIIKLGTNTGTVFDINSNSGYGFNVATNFVWAFIINLNAGIGYQIGTNNSSGIGFSIADNQNKGFQISLNRGTGIEILNTNGSARRGIVSYAADTGSITSGAKTAVFGKLAGINPAQMTFDGFGQMRMVRNNLTKFKIDTAGLYYGTQPHVHKIDTSSNFQITLTQGVFKKVSNATNNFWSSGADAHYFTFNADTVINTLKGHFTIQYQLNVTSTDNATYIYRIREKTPSGVISTIQRYEVRGNGVNNHRIIEADTKSAIAGCKYWLEIQWSAGGAGTPVTITGGSFFARTIHLLID